MAPANTAKPGGERPEDGSPDRPEDRDALFRKAADEVRQSGALGRRGRLTDLFDYLAQRRHDPVPPKESELAAEVFQKTDYLGSGDDPIVRVSVHRLRKTLADFYAAHPSSSIELTIPRGEYRLVMRDRAAAAEAAGNEGDAVRFGPKLKLAIIAIGLVLAIVSAAWVAASLVFPTADGRAVQNSAWQRFRNSPRPLAIVVSDAPLGGERGTVQGSPPAREGGADAEDAPGDDRVSYLPLSVADALKDIVPHLTVRNKRILLVPASKAGPNTLKENDILYIGDLHGLSFLEAPIFARSSFSVDAAHDRIVDKRSKAQFTSEEETPIRDPASIYKDFGFVSVQSSKDGTIIVGAIVGTGNMGLRGAAEMASSPTLPAAWERLAASNSNYGVLIEVRGQSYTSISNHVLSVTRIPDH